MAEEHTGSLVGKTLASGRGEKHCGSDESAIACRMDGLGNTRDIDNGGHYTLEGLVERTVVAAYTDEHSHFAHGKRVQTAVVGVGVTTEGYPNDGTDGALEGVPGGIDAAGGGIVDEMNATNAGYIFKTKISFVETGKAGAQRRVAHLAQTGGVNGCQPSVCSITSLIG